MTNLEQLLARLRDAAPIGEPAPFVVATDGTIDRSDDLGVLTTTYLHALADFVEAASATREPKEIAGLVTAVASSVEQVVYLDALAASLSPEALA